MKFPEPLESRMYGDPMEVCAARQAAEANRARKLAAQAPVKRPVITVKPRAEGEWSQARRRAEALFEKP